MAQQAIEARLLHRCVAMCAEADRFEDALQHCLEAVCEMTGWPVGHAYRLSADQSQLEPTTIWYFRDDDSYGPMRDLTEQTNFKPGSGLPGRNLAVRPTGLDQERARRRCLFQRTIGSPAWK